jgi:AraC-like DNA-binding protein
MQPVDVFADILERARARGSIYALSRLAAPWGFRFPADPCIQFHVVLGGACVLRLEGATLALHQGDVAFVVAAEEYELADAPGSAVREFEPLRETVRRERSLVWPGDGPATSLLCGGYELDRDILAPVCRLPPLIHVSAGESRVRPALRATIGLLTDEVQGGEPGAQVVADRLVDALLVQVLRSWLARGVAAAPGWPQLPRDVGVAAVLELLHERPHHPWTLGALAREASMSRSTLARRFTAAVGEPPISYLIRWRMTLAAELLRDTPTPLTAIAEHVGYDSVFAFSTAFKRVTGQAPSHYRARARAEVRTRPAAEARSAVTPGV